MNAIRFLLKALFVHLFVAVCVKANFEDARCRCTCPSTEYFSSKNKTVDGVGRRYYTKTNINPANCNTQTVVKSLIVGKVDEQRVDAFLANCNCKFELRNSLLIKVVVIFVIVVIMALCIYMGYLLLLEPMIKNRYRANTFAPYERHNSSNDDVGFDHVNNKSRTPGVFFNRRRQKHSRAGGAKREARERLLSTSSGSSSSSSSLSSLLFGEMGICDDGGQFISSRRHELPVAAAAGEMEDNIFAKPSTPDASSSSMEFTSFGGVLDEQRDNLQVRTRNTQAGGQQSTSQHISTGHHNGGTGGIIDRVVDRVVAEQEKWKSSVEEQRRHVLNRQMLN